MSPGEPDVRTGFTETFEVTVSLGANYFWFFVGECALETCGLLKLYIMGVVHILHVSWGLGGIEK